MKSIQMRGNVLRIRKDRGFGFLGGEGPYVTTEFFFHASDCHGCQFEELEEGMKVEFRADHTEGGKGNGWRARNVGFVGDEACGNGQGQDG